MSPSFEFTGIEIKPFENVSGLDYPSRQRVTSA